MSSYSKVFIEYYAVFLRRFSMVRQEAAGEQYGRSWDCALTLFPSAKRPHVDA